MLGVICAYVLKLAVFDASSIITNPYNKRLGVTDRQIVRGVIYDRNLVSLAETDETGERVYSYGKTLSHTVGYFGSVGSYGLEASLNFELERVNGEIRQRIGNIYDGTPIRGNNAVLTIDAVLSEYAYTKIKNYRGAVVVLEPATGKVLVSVSSPGFNSSTIENDWSSLKSSDGSPLMNRAFNGLYAPASTFKIITGLSALNTLGDEALNFKYVCNGETLSDGTICRCYGSHAHGELDFKKAFAVSCNAYFAELALKLPENSLKETAESFLYNRDLGLGTSHAYSVFDADMSEKGEIVQAATGQGKTLVTPIHEAMIAASIANGGVMMKPYIVSEITDKDGKTLKKYFPQALTNPDFKQNIEFIKECMRACVTDGTGKKANIGNIGVFAKTGTIDNPNGSDSSWFVGCAPYDYPEVVIAVILEESGSGRSTDIAADILSQIYK